MTERLEQFSDMLHSVIETVNENSRRGREVSNEPRGQEDRPVFQRNFRLDFPRFAGIDPTGWVFKAIQYFDFYQVPLHQKLMLASYHREGEALFEVLSNRLKGLFEKHKLSCFVSGLKDEIRLPVKMFNPLNLEAAFGLAKMQEEYVLSSRKPWRQIGHYSDKWPIDHGGGLSIKGQKSMGLKSVFFAWEN
ncbi:hypothetical protein F2P56_030929 [Juglans regia]|uniref:Uncharacterized protein n=1 Tax=Juglans regia TaxID=51240 RepID=A0A833WY26_JUGRE|nr:hypothetical protein F2P56_030929 [Juglans regia]